jgi:hypothetical protein
MMLETPSHDSVRYAKLVRGDANSQAEIAWRIHALLEALADVQILDSSLRQLWLETHWLKCDYEQGVLAVPTDFELLIFQIKRGQVPAAIKKYPEIVDAANELCKKISDHLDASR